MTAAAGSVRDRLEDLWGCSVLDRDGARIGSLEEVFYDADEIAPEWLGIGVGLLGRTLVLVPAEGARVSGISLELPFAGELVRDAPELPFDDLDAETRRRLREHYAPGALSTP